MRGWLVYTRQRYAHNQWMARRYIDMAERIGHQLSLVFAEDYCASTVQDTLLHDGVPDYAIFRCEDYQLRARLEHAGIRIFNTARISQICNDKWETHLYARSHGIPTLDTHRVDMSGGGIHTAEENHPYLSHIPYEFPYVLKPRDGHGGYGVALIENPQQLQEYVARFGHDIFLRCVAQKVSPVTHKDIRVYALGERIIAAVLRHSLDDFRSNFTRGARASLYTLSQSEYAVVHKTIAAFGADFAGFDFFPTPDGLILNEVEDVVGTRMLYALTDKDPVRMHLDYIAQQH